jgi:hypothetical protein
MRSLAKPRQGGLPTLHGNLSRESRSWSGVQVALYASLHRGTARLKLRNGSRTVASWRKGRIPAKTIVTAQFIV